MGSIRIQNVSKQFGGRVVLDAVSLELHTGEIVGLVGANGTGKTTLFRLIAGRLAADSGTVTVSRGLELGYLAQEPEIGLETTLHEEVISAFSDLLALERKLQDLSEQIAAEHDGAPARLRELLAQYDTTSARFVTAGGYEFEARVNEILGGLGFTEADQRLPMAALSGGQKCRAALAKLLLQDAQFLLLDEPTNHLDIDAVRWLEKFLAGHHGGAVVISHDRYLLDRVAQRIVEVDGAKLRSYPGNYTNYVKIRDVQRLTQERQYENDAEFIAKERDFIARHLAGQRSKEAQGRRTRLERRLAAGEFVRARPGERRTLRLDFGEQTIAGEVLVAEELGKRYDQKRLFDNLDLRISAGTRLGITGPNGTGKTTLLRILLGRVAPEHGTVRLANKLTIGYFAQDALDLHPEATVLAEIRTARPDYSEQQARTLLGTFLFSGDDVFKRIGDLSGGEQSRVRLIKLILASPNLLLLDEPTNHLDIPSREALEAALAEFPGTLIAVSHDRYFLDRIVRKLLVLRPGAHVQYNGNYSEYIAEVEQARAGGRSASAPRAGETAGARERAAQAGGPHHKEPRAGGPPHEGPRSGGTQPKGRSAKKPASPFARLTLEELETRIIDREAQLEELHARFAEPAVYRDPDAVQRLQAEFDALKLELTELHQAWETRIEPK